ncbi:MAG: SpoIIE family protein phosphatase [Alphaproteobacteria bacterium]
MPLTAPRIAPRLSLATRLYMGIAGAVAFTLIASIVAWLSLIQLGENQRKITRAQIPSMTESLRLAKQSALIAATVPELLTVDTNTERQTVMSGLQSQERELQDLVEDLHTIVREVLGAAEVFEIELEGITEISASLSSALQELDGVVETQLHTRESLQGRIDDAVVAHRQLTELVAPILDDTTFYLVTGYRSLDDAAPDGWTSRMSEQALLGYGALGSLLAEANLLAGLLTEAISAPTVVQLQPVRERLEASAHRFSMALGSLSALPSLREINYAYLRLRGLGLDSGGVLDLRRRSIELSIVAQGLVQRSRELAGALTEEVEGVVRQAQANAAAMVAATDRSIDISRTLLLVLNGVAIAGAFLIGWLYVKRSFTDPVLRVTNAAEQFERQRLDPAALAKTAGRSDELGHLARVFLRMAQEVQARTDTLDRLVNERTEELNQKNLALEKTLQRLEDELTMAQRMQLSILPRRYPDTPALSMFAHMQAAREVGGDFYDFIEIDNRHVGIVIADVSDKGVPAALLMAVACTKINSIALRHRSPGRVLEELNRDLCEGNDAAMFVTVFYGVIDQQEGRLVYANGGHNAPFLLRGAEHERVLPSTGGVALGLAPDLAYQENAIQFEPGDTVFLYTDGVTDAFDAHGQAFTEPKLGRLLYESRALDVRAIGERVVGEVETHTGAAPRSDDITCVVIRYYGGAAGRLPSRAPGEAVDDRRVFSVPNDLGRIETLAAEIEAFGEAQGLGPKLVFNINLVLDELLSNIINYGYGDDGRPHEIKVTVAREGEEIRIEVEDDARPFNPLTADAPDLTAPLEARRIGGLGIHLVQSQMDHVEYQKLPNGNRMILRKRIDD